MKRICIVCGQTDDVEPHNQPSLTTHGICDKRCESVFDEWANMSGPDKPMLRQLYWKRVQGESNGA